MESKESRGRRGASWELPQQSWPIAAELWDVSGSPEPSQTISFIKKERFKPDLKGREGVCFLIPNWQLLPQRRGPITEGSASHSTFRNSGNSSKPAV